MGSKSSADRRETTTQREPESALSVFRSVYKTAKSLKLCKENTVRDPVHCHAPPLSRIDIRKVMPTASKPLLIDLFVANRRDNFEYCSSTAILKQGDDLRRDMAVLHVFRLMNRIWRDAKLEYTSNPVNALTYKCVPMAGEFGLIELVQGCKPLRLVSALEDTISIGQQLTLVASAAGSYMAAYVMGVRDRHFDNVLVRDTDCTLFHIDFGFVLGDTASVDTSKLAITSDLKKLMGVFWSKFVELGVAAFLALRARCSLLVKFARIAFEHLVDGEKVGTFIRHQLRMGVMNDTEAAKYIERKLRESPDSIKTKFKNQVHRAATFKK